MALRLKWLQSISDVDEREWDALALPLKTPIYEWEWLRQMEVSGSIDAGTGWLPFHLTVRRDGSLVAAAPLYVKSHSEGEFVYDYMWADVAGKLNLQYYPKLVGMSPATPAIGYRFLMAPGEDEDRITGIMVDAIDQLCRKAGLSGCSFLFVDPEWAPLISRHGYVGWRHQSFAWENEGYGGFDDFLGLFRKNQRRNIRRERKKMVEQGIHFRAVSGEEIPRHYFTLMYDYYEGTNAQFGPWAAKYLTREFFTGLYENYRHRLLLMAAYRDDSTDEPIGMSFFLHKGNQLLGRYWGSSEKLDSLHFNTCYYEPIDWSIREGIQRFDPGAGSSHKARRGFRSVANHSMHRFVDSRLQGIMEINIDEINRLEQDQIDSLNEALPLQNRREDLRLPSDLRPEDSHPEGSQTD